MIFSPPSPVPRGETTSQHFGFDFTQLNGTGNTPSGNSAAVVGGPERTGLAMPVITAVGLQGKRRFHRRQHRKGAALFLAICAGMGWNNMARATAVLNTLLNFNVTDGQFPQAGEVTIGPDGNLYGTTEQGGSNGLGVVYELSGPNYRVDTTLASFNASSGVQPYSSVLLDAAGDIFGSTSGGGSAGFGTLFEISGSTHQTFTTIANFNSGNGSNPHGPLTADSFGNIFGVTLHGGTNGDGTVFELTGATHQNLTTLINFNSSSGSPNSLFFDGVSNNLYGTTFTGGAANDGSVFQLAGIGHQQYSLLASFNSSTGTGPLAAVTIDGAGNLYGTTGYGGVYNDGSVYELSGASHQNLKTIANFNGSNGANPYGGLIMDAVGNLFGTTEAGGGHNDGTVFELAGPNYSSVVDLVTFSGTNGTEPPAGLAADAFGNLFGVTTGGGMGNGTVFEVGNTGFVPLPEPASIPMLAFSCLTLLARRWRRADADAATKFGK